MKIEIRVKPNSKVEEIIQEEHSLSVKVKDPPVQGKANRAVIRLLAKHFGVPEGQVTILKGFTSRNKLIEVTDSVRGNLPSSMDGRGRQ